MALDMSAATRQARARGLDILQVEPEFIGVSGLLDQEITLAHAADGPSVEVLVETTSYSWAHGPEWHETSLGVFATFSEALSFVVWWDRREAQRQAEYEEQIAEAEEAAAADLEEIH